MNFLFPHVLWALLALAIPILVHLFHFRRPRRLLFSNLAFIREVQQVVRRRLRLKHYLLLAARLLLLAALVLMFSGPYWATEAGQRRQGSHSVAIIIDNSLSMSAVDERGDYLSQARKLAYTILRAHGPNATYQVQTTGRLLLSAPFVPQGEAMQALDQLGYADRQVSYAEVLNNAPLYFSAAANPVHTLYFISDFQQKTVMQDSIKLPPLPPGLEVRFAKVGTRAQPNVYVSGMAFEDVVIEQDKPINLRLTVHNDGPEDVQNLPLKVELEGKAVGVGSVSVAAGQQQQATLTFTPQQGGWQQGTVRLDDLPIEFDNERHFSFNIPEGSRILLVQGREDPGYLRTFYSRLMTQYRVELLDETRFSNVSLQDYSALVLAGVSRMSDGLAARIKSWVAEEGGGLLIFPASDMQQSFRSFMQTMGLGAFGTLNTYTEPVQLPYADLQDPLFQGVFSDSKQDARFDSPSFSKLYDFTPHSGSIHNVILRDARGNAVLTKTQLQAGLVFTFSCFPSLAWGDFPIKSSFVPILYRATMLVNNAAHAGFSQTIGAYTLHRVQAKGNGNVKLRKGDQVFVPEQYEQAGQTLLSFEGLPLQPGTYAVVQEDSVLERISFNLSDTESQLAAASTDELSEALENRGLDEQVKVLKGEEAVVRKEAQLSAAGVPLWRYFLWVALFCLLAEVLIVRFMR